MVFLPRCGSEFAAEMVRLRETERRCVANVRERSTYNRHAAYVGTVREEVRRRALRRAMEAIIRCAWQCLPLPAYGAIMRKRGRMQQHEESQL